MSRCLLCFLSLSLLCFCCFCCFCYFCCCLCFFCLCFCCCLCPCPYLCGTVSPMSQCSVTPAHHTPHTTNYTRAHDTPHTTRNVTHAQAPGHAGTRKNRKDESILFTPFVLILLAQDKRFFTSKSVYTGGKRMVLMRAVLKRAEKRVLMPDFYYFGREISKIWPKKLFRTALCPQIS
jgi:hypothetical protein